MTGNDLNTDEPTAGRADSSTSFKCGLTGVTCEQPPGRGGKRAYVHAAATELNAALSALEMATDRAIPTEWEWTAAAARVLQIRLLSLVEQFGFHPEYDKEWRANFARLVK